MGRAPCCDKIGTKKGPWTPEEDIILVSYVRDHGPGNWRSVSTNTGLLRCSKSCRLRWTNYLRPGIKRGFFTPYEEAMIIHLQSLLGNKWAAIASYLPQRTDNDIKNYWNTHLKKKLNKSRPPLTSSSSDDPKNFKIRTYKKNDDHEYQQKGSTPTNSTFNYASNSSASSTNSNTVLYASSTENISRLLQGWMRSSQTTKNSDASASSSSALLNDINHDDHSNIIIHDYYNKHKQYGNQELMLSPAEEFDDQYSILSLDHNSNVAAGGSSTCRDDHKYSDEDDNDDGKLMNAMNNNHVCMRLNNPPSPPLSFLEKWLLEETSAAAPEEDMI